MEATVKKPIGWKPYLTACCATTLSLESPGACQCKQVSVMQRSYGYHWVFRAREASVHWSDWRSEE